MKELVCLAIFVILSAFCALLMIGAGFLCQYGKKTSVNETIYECGVTPFDDARVKFDLKYLNYAVLFLIFDVETIFLYPFAVSVNALGLFAAVEAFLFVFILLLGLFFVIRRKFLRWI